MYVYKHISPNDIQITPFKAYKGWSISTPDLGDIPFGIKLVIASSSIPITELDPLAVSANWSNYLYYKNASMNYYGSQSFFIADSEFVPIDIIGAEFYIISIPKAIFGEKIKETTFEIIPTDSSRVFKDDGHGNIYQYKVDDPAIVSQTGNIIYEDGIIILNVKDCTNISFNSTVTKYEYEAICTMEPNEFCVTLNPSTRYTGSYSSSYADWIQPQFTGSVFSPYVTTVGLYNDSGELLIIGKTSHPVKKSMKNTMNFIIRFDM